MMKRAVLLLSCLTGSVSLAHAEDGKAVYQANCNVCHQAAGAGSPGQYPPLAGRIGKIATSADGKAYVTHVLLSGLHGPIQANGADYTGFMPSFKALSDEQIAAVLTYIASLQTTESAPTFSADDVKTARTTPKKAKEVLAERKALSAAHIIP